MSVTDIRDNTLDCIIVGAGVAGVCTALSLQEAGARVALVEENGPGLGASFGNAGIVVNTKLMPVFAGLTPAVLLSMLRNPASPLNVRWSRFPLMVPWFLRMLRHAGPSEVERITHALASLCQPGASLYERWWNEAGMADLVEARGSIALNRSEAERDRDWDGNIAMLREMGVPMEKVGRAEIRDMAPSVSDAYTHGIYSPNFHHTISPQLFVERLHDLFSAKGGRVVRARVEALCLDKGRVIGVRTVDDVLRAGAVVVAAGTASAQFAVQAGERVPHQAVGGYHVMLNNPGLTLETPILPIDFRFAITPMGKGIRLAGIYEFGGETLGFKDSLIANMLAHVDKVLPGIRTDDRSVWRGFRSYLPDGLPVISRSARHEGLHYLFGLSSAGMINGATAGRAAASLVTGEKPAIDMRPFAIDRFAIRGR